MMLPLGTKAFPGSSHMTTARVPHRWLALARGAWIVCAVLLLANFVASIPAYYRIMRTVCTFPNQVPCTMPGGGPPSGQLTPDNVAALAHLHLSVATYAAYYVTLQVAVSLLCWGVGLLIFWRKSDEGMGLFVSLLLVLYGATSITNNFLVAYAPTQKPLLFQILLALISVAQWAGLGVFFLTFPTGRFVPRWSWLLILPWVITSEWNPISPVLQVAESLLLFGSAFFIMVYRYVRVFDAVQRQQTKWFVYATAVGITLSVISAVLPGVVPADSLYQLVSPTTTLFSFALIPLGLGIAILRYRLWDIDVIINRTLVYATLTAGIVGMYILIVVGFGTLMQVQGNPVLSLLAAALVAVLFQPLRQRLQHAVNRLIYGERDDPYRVISHLGQRLEATVASDTILPTIVETVAQALKLPYVAIALQQDGELTVAASYGTRDAREELHLPLAYQTEQVGELVLAPRAPGEAFSAADRRLLEDLARQVDIAAHAVRLTADLKRLTQDLQQARERLVSAREEERRRLRRDLHDGLGPQLSSQTLLLTSVQMLLRQDPDEAEAILRSAIAQSQEAISDIRRLVYALRPPALDDLGLVAAIAEQLTQNRASGIAFSFEAREPLPPLPAAVEVACYRIVQEAITNVVRHAHARNCTVHLLCEEQLTIEVIDDGLGLPPAYHHGVGLTSMRERAEELGGSWLIEPGPHGGTCVQVQIPYR